MHKTFCLLPGFRLMPCFTSHWPFFMSEVARQTEQTLADLDTAATRWLKGVKRNCMQSAGGIICFDVRLVNCLCVMLNSCAESSISVVGLLAFMASQ